MYAESINGRGMQSLLTSHNVIIKYVPLPNPPLLREGTVDEVTIPPLTRGGLGGGSLGVAHFDIKFTA